MTDDNSNLVDMDDLDAFEAKFFNREPVATDEPEKEEPEAEEEDLENVDDADATNENDETDEGEDEPEADEEPEEKPEPKKKQSAQERINELTRKAREAERREAELLKRLEAIEARKTEDTKSEPKPLRETLEADAPNPDALDDKGEPKYKLGEFDPQYIRDLTKWTIDRETKAAKEAAEAEARETEIKAQQEALSTAWAEKVTEAEKELPDLREKLSEMDVAFKDIDPSYGEYLAATIMSCDFGPQIMYYLSQNIGEAQKIVTSGPAAATLKLGELNAKFRKPAEEKRNTKKVSEAPKPPENRVRGSSGKFGVSGDTDDLDAFERAFFNRK